MSDPKHTPGPWHVERCRIYKSNPTGLIATTAIRLADGETEANADLIAAAPELLEALENLVSHAQETAFANNGLKWREDAARAAIAKAKGGEA